VEDFKERVRIVYGKAHMAHMSNTKPLRQTKIVVGGVGGIQQILKKSPNFLPCNTAMLDVGHSPHHSDITQQAACGYRGLLWSSTSVRAMCASPHCWATIAPTPRSRPMHAATQMSARASLVTVPAAAAAAVGQVQNHRHKYHQRRGRFHRSYSRCCRYSCRRVALE